MKSLVSVMLAMFVFITPDMTAAQSNYPDKPIRIIVGFTAGSATDVAARMLGEKLAEALGVSVWVDNVPGAGGNIGTERAARAPADGYTVMFTGNGALTISPSVYSNLPYDPVRDLVPVSLLLAMPNILAVHNAVPAKSVPELAALARSQPGKLTFATPGVGTPQHMAGELFKIMAGIDIVHVPYRGAIVTDVLGGRVTMIFSNTGVLLPLVREQRLRGLAVTSAQRSPNIPELPTMAEEGYSGFEATSWFGLAVPAGTPPAVVSKLHDESVKILAQPGLRDRFAQLGMEPVGNSPEEFAAIIKSDILKWQKVIKEADIKPE